MNEHASVIRVTTFRPAPGRRDDLLETCREIQQQVQTAEGCFGAQVCTAEEEPDAIVAISRWANRRSLDTMLATRGERLAGLRVMLAADPVTRHYTPVE